MMSQCRQSLIARRRPPSPPAHLTPPVDAPATRVEGERRRTIHWLSMVCSTPAQRKATLLSVSPPWSLPSLAASPGGQQHVHVPCLRTSTCCTIHFSAGDKFPESSRKWHRPAEPPPWKSRSLAVSVAVSVVPPLLRPEALRHNRAVGARAPLTAPRPPCRSSFRAPRTLSLWGPRRCCRPHRS